MKNVYINLYDKKNILETARELNDLGYNIYSQGSTANYLMKNEIDIIEIKKEEYHPNIVLISSIIDRKSKKIPRPSFIILDIIDEDIYNSILLIAAVNNNIPVITNKDDYEKTVLSLKVYGEINENLEKELKYKALSDISFILARKSTSIFPYINKQEKINLPLEKIKDLKFGENPHQKAALYRSSILPSNIYENIEVLNGDINFNHLIDINKARDILSEIDFPVIFTIKYSNISYFAYCVKQYIIDEIKYLNKEDVLVSNITITPQIIELLEKSNLKALVSTDYSQDITNIIKNKKLNIRIFRLLNIINLPQENEIYYLAGNFLIQEKDISNEIESFKIMTNKKKITEIKTLKMLFTLLKHTKTYNAIITDDTKTLAISEGNTTTENAIKDAINEMCTKNTIKSKNYDNLYLATDGSIDFKTMKELLKFPFKTIIQNGRHKDDEKCIEIANLHNISMIFTSKRHIKHL